MTALMRFGCLLMLFGASGCTNDAQADKTRHINLIAGAILNYRETYREYPPASLIDEAGRGVHSWRVLIVPYVEANKFFNQYDLDSAWNEGRNHDLALRLQVASSKGAVYECFTCDPNHLESAFVMVVDDTNIVEAKSAPIKTRRAIGSLVDGEILVLELTGSGVHWMEPRDYSYRDFANNPEIGKRIKRAVVLDSDGRTQVVASTEARSIIAEKIRALKLNGS